MQHLLPTYGPRPLTVDSGDGCYLIDVNGKRYLDFITGIGVNALGYRHPRLLAEMRDQIEKCIHSSNLHAHRYQEELAGRLKAWTGLDRVFLSNSGSEAMEAALKAARARANLHGRRRHRVIVLENGFHGRTAGSLSITGNAKYREPFAPLLPDVVFVPANDVAALEAAATEETIAIVTETIQGEGGIFPMTEAFSSAVRNAATAHDALWIADETQCGLGRTGEYFAYQMYPAVPAPDVVVTAKPLAGGLPLGATIFSERAGEAITRGMHGTTFGGGPLACRISIAFLEEVERILPNIRSRGEYFQAELRRLPNVREVRGRGLMAGIELNVPGDQYVERALAEGLVINGTHGNVLRFLPPYIVTYAEIDQACAILARVLSA